MKESKIILNYKQKDLLFLQLLFKKLDKSNKDHINFNRRIRSGPIK